jgi:hypothetical protein
LPPAEAAAAWAIAVTITVVVRRAINMVARAI